MIYIITSTTISLAHSKEILGYYVDKAEAERCLQILKNNAVTIDRWICNNYIYNNVIKTRQKYRKWIQDQPELIPVNEFRITNYNYFLIPTYEIISISDGIRLDPAKELTLP